MPLSGFQEQALMHHAQESREGPSPDILATRARIKRMRREKTKRLTAAKLELIQELLNDGMLVAEIKLALAGVDRMLANRNELPLSIAKLTIDGEEVPVKIYDDEAP